MQMSFKLWLKKKQVSAFVCFYIVFVCCLKLNTPTN